MNEFIAKLNNIKLSPEEKRELLAKLLQQKANNPPSFFPLSYIQQGLWSLYRIDPQSWAYNVLFSAKIVSLIDLDAFKKSWQILVDRHESLRTNYATKDSLPIQQIHPHQEFNLEEIDASSWSQAEENDRVKEIIHRPFNLEKEPVIRVSLLSKSATESILLLVIHHIAVDLWSLIVLLDELRLIYQAQSSGSPLTLSPVKSQYTDYLRWQTQMLAEPRGQKLQNYWKNKLAGELPVLDLPIDRPRSPIQTFAGASHIFKLETKLTDQLKSLARKESASLYTVLLAALQLLLYRYSGQEEISIGSTAACRNGREFAGVIGACLNPIVLRGDLSGNPAFTTLLVRLRDTVLEALQHQEYPFQLLTQQLQIAPDLSRSPIYQVMFLLQKLHRSEDLSEFIIPHPSDSTIDFGGLAMQPYPLAHQEGNHDLMLEAIETGGLLKCILKYNPLLFDAATIVRMTGHFQTLLENIVAAPQNSLSTFSLLSATERQELSSRRNLVRARNPFTEFPKSEIEQSIVARFEKQVERYSDRIAIETDNYCWTYRELERQVNYIAQKILEFLPEREAKISLLFEHDALAIAAILAVLKTGRTYVPLDPNYPQDRIAYILEDSLSSLILTNNRNLDRAKYLTGEKLPIVNIDEIDRTDTISSLNLEISPDTIAYLLYTSGSTGTPKGVIQNHRNVLHFIRNYTNNLHIAPDDKLTLLSSYSFDAALMDIFGALLNGATLCLFNIREEGLQDLDRWLNHRKITIYHSTPTVYRYFLDTLTDKKQFTTIRLVVLGGEEVVKKDIELYQKNFAEECIFINGFGPTESTVTLQYFIDKQTGNSQNKVPVGYPVEDTEIILLDATGTPTDLLGEIAIRSPHVALGYWHKPELTAAAFLDNSESEKQRIYRTGDWGRWRRDGSFEFLGRKDSQVKIRGFRIELGEIEANLASHPDIKEVAVLVKDNSFGDKCLVAYIVSQTEFLPTISSLNHYLSQRIPKYTIPSNYIFLDTFPLSPSGKIQRQALPEPNFNRSTSESQEIEPHNEIEGRLLQIWQRVLNVPAIGREDDFFDLGGNSLLVIRLIAEIEKFFSQKIPITTFLELSTIAKLATAIEHNSAAIEPELFPDPNTPDDLPQLTPRELELLLASTITKKRFLSTKSLIVLEQQGNPNHKTPLFFVYLLGDMGKYFPVEKTIYNLTVWARVEKPETFVKAIAAYYVKEIRAIQPEGPYYLAGYCLGGAIALEIALQLQKQGQIVAHLSLIQTKSPDPDYQRDREILLKFGYEYWLRLVVKWRELRKIDNLSDRIVYLKNRLNGIANKIISKFTSQRNRTSKIDESKKQKSPKDLDYTIYETEVRLSLRRAIECYHPEPYSGDITLLFATEGTLVSFLYPDGGWSQLLTGKVNIHKMPGNHTQILRDPQASILAKKVVLSS